MSAKTVLIVEDNYDNRAIYTVALEIAGFQVIEAHNGEEGVQLARECRPDIIIMDLSMPVLDGWGAVQKLKSDPGTAHIPVLALSAHVVLNGDYRRSREAGFAAYLTKPVEPKQVVLEVQAHLASAPPLEEPPTP